MKTSAVIRVFAGLLNRGSSMIRRGELTSRSAYALQSAG
jgi:hypothetical protein